MKEQTTKKQCDVCEGSGELDYYAGECSDPDCCGIQPDDYMGICYGCEGTGLIDNINE